VGEHELEHLRPLDRQHFSAAVQAGLAEMAAADIDEVFDLIDLDKDGESSH
jgi:hypothetical protein